MKPYRVPLLLVLVVGDVAACTAILGVSDIPPAPDAATSTTGATGSSSTTGASSSSGAADGPASCPVRYVSSATGSDGNDGCTHETALKTIATALSLVESAGEAGYVIHVCRGTYPEENLTVELAGSIVGAFDCQTWEQTGAWGYPTFDTQNQVVITNAKPNPEHTATLTVKAAADAGPSLLLEGLTIEGADGIDATVGVAFAPFSGGTITNCQVLGGSGVGVSSVTVNRSRSIQAISASPAILSNAVVTGVTNGSGGFAAGIFLTSSLARVQGNTISASNTGPAVSFGGSYGLYVTASASSDIELTVANDAAISGNNIMAGTGEPSVGIHIDGPITADIVSNVVQGTRSPGADGGMTNVGVAGLYSTSTRPLYILGNLFYGGGNSNQSLGKFEGVHLQGVPGAVIANNLIYGGFSSDNVADRGIAAGIQLQQCISPTVEDNTIFTGYPGVVDDAQALLIVNGTTGATVRGNILAGGGIRDYAVHVDACTGELAALENNLFIGLTSGTLLATGPTCMDAGPMTVHDVTGIGPYLAGATVGGNVIMTDKCSAADDDAGSCIDNPACDGGVPGSVGCLSTLFGAGWSASNGFALWQASGWAPQAAGEACRIIQGGIDLADAGFPVATDLRGAPRGATPTIGAVEVADASCD